MSVKRAWLKIGPALTLLAIAFAAFFLADVAHEGIGHGGGCVASGGQILLLSTTYAECSIRSRLIDGAGPVVGLLVALLAWVWLRFLQPRTQAARAFLCLLFAFTAFWNVGYMVESGLLDRGDWKFVIAGLEPASAWHVGLVVCGVIFYVAAMRLLRGMLERNFDPGEGWRPRAFALVALLGASFLAAAGGAFDPRGPGIILSDALPAALSSFGLVLIGRLLERRVPVLRVGIPASPGWIITGLVCATVFVFALGPGLRF